MKNFEFIWDPEEERRKKKFSQNNLKFLIDDSTLLIKNLKEHNIIQKKEITNINSWTIKNMYVNFLINIYSI